MIRPVNKHPRHVIGVWGQAHDAFEEGVDAGMAWGHEEKILAVKVILEMLKQLLADKEFDKIDELLGGKP